MKKIVIIISILFLQQQIKACDICGCGAGNSYIGILPDFYKHIIGVRYRYNILQTHLGPNGESTYLTSNERYRTAELWGGWNFGKHFRLMASVPFSFNEKTNQGISTYKDGIGDVSLSAYYQLLNNKSSVGNKLLVQSLWLGAGIKLPTGVYNPADKNPSAQSANLFQLGTGSTDFSLSVMYDLRLQDVGLNISSSYKMNTANRYDYNYGNKLNSSAQLYYKIDIAKKMTVAPNTGLLYETSKNDLDKKTIVDVSGGNTLLSTVGLEASMKKISFGANWQKPLSQDLALGIVKAGNRMMIHAAFVL